MISEDSFLPAAVDRHDRRGVHSTNRSEVVVTALHPQVLHVCRACSLQTEAHSDSRGIFLVGSKRHQARSLDGVPTVRSGSVEEGSQVHRCAKQLHARSQRPAGEWVHSAHQHASSIALDLTISVIVYQRKY